MMFQPDGKLKPSIKIERAPYNSSDCWAEDRETIPDTADSQVPEEEERSSSQMVNDSGEWFRLWIQLPGLTRLYH